MIEMDERVSRLLTLWPALNRLGIPGMEQVSFPSNLVDFALGAITLHREN